MWASRSERRMNGRCRPADLLSIDEASRIHCRSIVFRKGRTAMKATLAQSLVVLAALSLLPLGCSSGDDETEGRVITTKSGLKIETLKVGTGAPAKRGDLVEMRYTGWLNDGTKFDSSDDHKGEPFFFSLGQG